MTVEHVNVEQGVHVVTLERLVSLEPACVERFRPVWVSQLELFAILYRTLMCVNVLILYLLVRVERNVPVEHVLVSKYDTYLTESIL